MLNCTKKTKKKSRIDQWRLLKWKKRKSRYKKLKLRENGVYQNFGATPKPWQKTKSCLTPTENLVWQVFFTNFDAKRGKKGDKNVIHSC